MRQYEDYYRILQVHYLAEPEIIDSAYKRLVKKYHPDVNKSENSGVMMQRLNLAYEALNDQAKRQQYDIEWRQQFGKLRETDNNHTNVYEERERFFKEAKAVLEEYFKNIIDCCFEASYELISRIEKQNISKDSFINWQKAVSKISRLKEFNCKAYDLYQDKLPGVDAVSDIVEFGVYTQGYNAVMDMVEKDAFTKKTVLEDGKWRVLVGYRKLQPMISKYEALTSLLTAKTVIKELVEEHSRVDSTTGLLNKRGILERVENEIHRFNRYGNVFSFLLCEIEIDKMSEIAKEQEICEYAIRFTSETLLNNLRKLDVVGRLGEMTFLVLLPETGLTSAEKTVQKLLRIWKTREFYYNDKEHKVFIDFYAVEYEASLSGTQV